MLPSYAFPLACNVEKLSSLGLIIALLLLKKTFSPKSRLREMDAGF